MFDLSDGSIESSSMISPRFLATLAVFSCLTVSSQVQAQPSAAEPAQTPAGAPNAEAAQQALDAKLESLAALPENASPEEMLQFVESAWQTPIKASSNQEANIMKIHVLGQIIAGSEQILAAEKVEEEIALGAVQNKMQALGVLSQAGDPTAPQRAMALARDLAEDERPKLAREGKLILLSSQLRSVPEMSEKEREEFATTLVSLFSQGSLTERELEIANITATLFEQSDDYPAAAKVLKAMAEQIKKSDSPEVRARLAEFEGGARRMALPGKPLEVSGETLAGKELSIKDLKGKVVLVQYWASWCTYCLQETPHIKQMYEKYHDQGFEVVGVNLDEARGRADQIVQQLELPWPQLFSEDPNALGMENPNAARYGVNGIPLCILVDREGNVVSLQARGGNLVDELAKLFPESKGDSAE